MGAVVVTADPGQATDPATVDTTALVRAAAARASDAYTEQLRSQAVDAAQSVVAEVTQVRADAAEHAVPDDVLAELDAATADLEALLQDLDATPLDDARESAASRSAERGDEDEDDAASADGAAGSTSATPGATTAPSSGTSTDGTDAGADASSTSSGTSDSPATTAGAEDDTADAGADDDVAAVTTDPVVTPLRDAVARVEEAAALVRTTTEQKKAEVAAAQVAAAEVARVEAEKAAQRAAWKASLQGYANGQIPSSALCALSFDASARLRCDAAESLDALDAAFFAQFGTHLTVSDSYRSYAAQVACRAAKGSLCAAPGTSNHGLGVAVDLGGKIQTFGTAEHVWLRENAPAYQWTLPEWARAGGSKPEPWHWEYVG